MKRTLLHLLQWALTLVALNYAFRGIDWGTFRAHLWLMQVPWFALGFALTCGSYLLRARRWESLFPTPTLRYVDSVRVLILGFFMNNVLPGRAGELVRAHMGSKVTGEKRTLVLATVASERLIDGFTISVIFLLFGLGLGDSEMERGLFLVACLFGVVTAGVLVTLAMREPLFVAAKRVAAHFNNRAAHYVLEKFQIFINGLSPLTHKGTLPAVVAWSVVVWLIEMAVYYAVGRAYGVSLPWGHVVLFMVAVNFASLVPLAPGGLGMIEAVGSRALMSIGVSQELALTMVVTQHLIQYVVVGIPGAMIMLTWKKTLREINSKIELESGGLPLKDTP